MSTWRGEARCVLALSFDVDAEAPVLAVDPAQSRNLSAMSHQAYGPRVGVPRILALLEDLGLRATFFIPGVTAERYPGTVEAILERGHEVGHHSHMHFSPIDCSEEEDRRDFERALRALERFGARPQGYRSPNWESAAWTPRLLAEHGFLYDSSLMDADVPYVLELDGAPLVELPVHWALDDWEHYMYLPRPEFTSPISSPKKVLDVWTRELDAMAKYGGLFVLTCHPFISGRPSRVEAIRQLVEHALDRGDVTVTCCEEVAGAVLEDSSIERRPFVPPSEKTLGE